MPPVQQVGATSSLFGPGAENQLPAGDPRRAVVQQLRTGQLGSGSAQLCQIIHDSSPGFRLSDLPPKVAEQMIESRGKAIDRFLKSWADDIAKQAKLDAAASKRARKLKHDLGLNPNSNASLRRARAVFAQVVSGAAGRTLLGADAARQLRLQAGLSDAADAGDPPSQSAQPATSGLVRGLAEPPSATAMRLRRS